MDSSVGMVILDFDDRKETVRCLRSITEGTVLPDVVVLVENGQSGLRPEQVAELREDINLKILQPGSNLGCAGGRNLGLNYLQENTSVSRFVTLDNDTIVPPDFVDNLCSIDVNEEVVLAPVIMTIDGEAVWSSGGTIHDRGKITKEETEFGGDTRYADWAPMTCLAIHRSMWERVGELDEWIEFFFEDVDWCLRLQEAEGRVVVRSDLRIRHDTSLSAEREWTPERVHFWTRNGAFFRSYRLDMRLRNSLKWIATQGHLALRDLLHGRVPWATARVKGICEGTLEAFRRSQ